MTNATANPLFPAKLKSPQCAARFLGTADCGYRLHFRQWPGLLFRSQSSHQGSIFQLIFFFFSAEMKLRVMFVFFHPWLIPVKLRIWASNKRWFFVCFIFNETAVLRRCFRCKFTWKYWSAGSTSRSLKPTFNCRSSSHRPRLWCCWCRSWTA